MAHDDYVKLQNNKSVAFQLPDGKKGKATASFDADGFLKEFDSSVVLNRYSPVLQKRIGAEYQKNIAITGKFRTNCNVEVSGVNGGYSFINVRKNSTGVASAYSGYGFAWKPSTPEYEGEIEITGEPTASLGFGVGYYDIPVATDPGADNNLMYMAYGTPKTYVPFHYTSYDNVTKVLTGCYLPTKAPTEQNTLCLMSPNIYICDNDPVHGDMYASKYVIDPLTGLSYIQSGTWVIEPNKNYWFKMIINSDNAISVYLNNDGSPFDETDKIITCGATTPISEYLEAEGMDSFGVSVYDTCGYQWWYDNLKISKLGGEYAVAYFKFDVSDMPEDLQIELSGYGTSEQQGINVRVRDHNGSGKWDTILTAPVSDYAVMVTNIISKTAYAVGGMIDVMVTTLSPSTETIPSVINLDYIKVVRAMVSGVHMGGCVDLYIDDPSAGIDDFTGIINSDTSSINFSGKGNISSIKIGDNDLLYAKDYVISEADPSLANSILSQPLIKFSPNLAGETATISYWASDAVSSAQSLVNSDEHRPLGLNILVKHKSIHEISLGDVTPSIKEVVVDYLDGLKYVGGVKTISYSDMSKYMYGVLGRYEPVVLSIKSFEVNRMKNRVISSMGQDYSINETDTFRVMP